MVTAKNDSRWSRLSSLVQSIVFQLGLIVFTLIVIELLCWLAITLRHSGGEAKAWESYQLSEGMQQVKMDEVITKHVLFEQDDCKRIYTPYHLWNEEPGYSGNYLHINQDGERITPDSAKNKDATKKVWLTGGSTMWGLGVPDESTIANHLAKVFAGDGKPVQVLNLGERAFVVNQEMIRVIEKLRDGETPDVIVFYNGANDGYYSTYNPGIPGYHSHYSDIKERVEKRETDLSKAIHLLKKTGIGRMFAAIMLRLQSHKPTPFHTSSPEFEKNISQESIDQRAKALAQIWLNIFKLITDLGKQRGFEVYFVLQPELNEHGVTRPLMEYEKTMLKNNWTDKSLYAKSAAFREIKKVIRQENNRHLVDLTTVFDDVDEKVFYDIHHLSSRGNRIVAEEIAEFVKPSLFGEPEKEQSLEQNKELP